MKKYPLLLSCILTGSSALSIVVPEAAAKRAPKELRAAGKTFHARLSLTPVAEGQADASPGLRSLTLRASPGMRVEAVGTWPNGRPVSAEVVIDQDDVRRLLRRLAKDGFFKKAGKYRSVRNRADPAKAPPPADSLEYPPAPRKDPHCRVTLISNDEYWYTYYEADWGWGPDMLSKLEGLRNALKDEAAKAVAELIAAAKEGHQAGD